MTWTISTYFNQFALADYGPGYDETCDAVIGSFDPNDKAATPEGFGNQHFIERGQEIEYKIRFQNTGTDTAFTVVVRDTLSAFVDPNSVRTGVSSHPFELDFPSENVLRFKFKNILLVDSFTNEPASHGFFTYKIAQKPALPLGSVIKNSAAIFFDYNAPVITNETFHTIGENFLTISTGQVFFEKTSVEVLPNPMGDRAEIRVKGMENEPLTLRLFTAEGRFLLEKRGLGNSLFIDRTGLPQSLLMFFIEKKNGHRVAAGKVSVN